MEEEFYAVIKLVSGEEIFSKVSASEEYNRIMLILFEPTIMTRLKTKSSDYVAYKIEPWLKNTSEDMFIIEMNSVITIVESFDEDMNDLYEKYLDKKNALLEAYNVKSLNSSSDEPNFDDVKDMLEKIYKEL